MTNKRSKIYKGVLNNLFAKIQGYPTVFIFNKLRKNEKVVLDVLYKKIIERSQFSQKDEKICIEIFEWYKKELKKRKIQKNDIRNCILTCRLIEKPILLFSFNIFNFNVYYFKLESETSLKKFVLEHKVYGWL